jgi:hypothetical protein
MPKYSILFARFPFLNQECPDTTDWLIRTAIKTVKDQRISTVEQARYDDTPVTMTRNQMIRHAKQLGVDYLCMVDSDMYPDCEPDGKPFWDTTFNFMLQHEGPCIVGAPYCGPPPVCSVYVFRWCNNMNPGDCYYPDMRLEMIPRECAAKMQGFEKVAALPTGLMMVDMRAISKIKAPYFYYEWKDEEEAEKGSTEDVTFTRDTSFAGVPLYVNWDAWAGHWKRYCVKKPRLIDTDHVKQKFKDALADDFKASKKLIMLGDGVSAQLRVMPTEQLLAQGGTLPTGQTA